LLVTIARLRANKLLAGDHLTRPGAKARLIVALLAAAAAVWAAVVATTAFPYFGINLDEAVYVLQADSLRAGRLFPPAPGDPEVARTMLPWLTAHRGDVYVPKYSPVWPAVLAGSRFATGSYHTAQALVAAGVVVVTYLLAKQILRERATAVVAAAFMTLSPLFLLQATTFLSYLPNVLLLELFALFLLRAVDTGSRPLFVLSGLALGVAFFARPFDAVVFALPFGAWLVVTRRRPLADLARHLALLALGAAPPLAATLLYFWASTGSPLRSPFLLDEHDTLGFGSRRIFAEQPLTSYGPGEAWYGLVKNWALVSFWCFGGLVLIALAVIGLRKRASSVEPWFALVALTVPAGYLFFWGSYFGVQWEGPWRLGPYYYAPVLIPLAVLGAKGFARFWNWDRLLALLALVGMVAVSASVVFKALDHQIDRTEGLRDVNEALETSTLTDALVFLPAYEPRRLLHPFTEARNVTFDQEVLWALDSGSRGNRKVLDTFPERRPYLLQDGARPELRPLTRLQGERVPLRIVTNAPGVRDAMIELLWRGRRYVWRVDERKSIDILLTSSLVEAEPPVSAPEPAKSVASELVVRLVAGGEDLESVTVPIEVRQRRVDLLLPSESLAEPRALEVLGGNAS
jgi:hypothetical protein